MALNLILGNSGSGKSYQAYQEIIRASIAHPERNFLVIVPEQFTMQTQKELVKLHPKKGILNIDVLSFQRLAYRVFEEVGADKRIILEEIGKSLLIRKAAAEQKDKLKVLKRNLNKIGYIQEVKSVISEFKQYDISVEQLDQMMEQIGEKPQLYYKMQDIQVLYQAFQEKLQEKYITAEDTLDVLGQVIGESNTVKGSVVLLDEFTGFTPLQQKLIRELLKCCLEVTVTVTMDVREDPWRVKGMHELFYLSKKTIHTLTEIAKDAGVQIGTPKIMKQGDLPRFKEAPVLAFLEQHFLRRDRGAYVKEPEGISIHTAKNAMAETHFAARTILQLVRHEGYRYQDIAIVTGDITSYGVYVRRIFTEYDIPVFIDETKRILLNPFLEFIRAALEVAARNYSYESIIRLLRTELCDLAGSDIDRLENYILAAGIRGNRMWKEPWERKTRRIDIEEVAYCEELREQLMKKLQPFTDAVKTKKTDVREKTAGLYQLIKACQIQEKLAVYEERFKEAGNLDTAKEYGQIYRVVIELLEKTVELLGEEQISLKEYTEILEAGFDEAKVGLIPPTTDRIVVGDIKRTRLKNIKALIFLGLNDGWVPGTAKQTGILSEMDRDNLTGAGVELAPGSREEGYIQRFYLYLIMTKPSHRLYLSYSKSKTDGGAMRPSYVVNRIANLFPKIQITDEDIVTSRISRISTPENGLHYLLEGIQQIRETQLDDEWKELYTWYYKSEEWRERLESLVEAAFYTRTEKGLSKAIAKALYGSVLENSVSRLERFAGCAFSHFITYGLGLLEREEYVFQPVDMGNIIHKVIEVFSQKIEQSEYTWFDLPEELSESWTEECVEEAAQEYGGQILKSSARNAYIVQRMKRIMKRTVWGLCKQVRAGTFTPSNYEVSFSMVEGLEAVNIALTEDEKMKLRGRIDRIDTCDNEDSVYVKVIDYKSGNTGFDMVALYYGLQLQLVVYLNAAMEMEKRISPEKEIIPAGIFYYRTQDPMIDRQGGETPEEINEQLLKKLKLSGLVNEDPEVVKSMDTQIGKDSTIIPVSYNKDGSPSRYASVATKERFHKLSGYVNEKIRDLGRRIVSGETGAVPYQRKGKTACDYCEYLEICGFDTKIPGTHFKRLKEYKTEEIWNKMDEEVR